MTPRTLPTADRDPTDQAVRLDEAAREHMRAARRHRRRAKELRRQLDELITACAQRGITVHLNRPAQGEPSGSQQQVRP